MSQLSIDDLTLIRGERLVLRGFTAAAESGKALILRGPNGSGKSSLLRALAGLLPATAGDICWDGKSVAKDWDAHRRRLIHIGHLDGLKPALTATENLDFWLNLAGEGPATAALEAFDLEQLKDRPARILSAGQRRRVALSRLAVSRARLWLLDEPTTALDKTARSALLTIISRHLSSDGIAIIATHESLDLPGTDVELPAPVMSERPV